jgi:hypothetical protein
LPEILPAVAVNVVEVAPAGTVTRLADTGNSPLLLDRDISVPPAGAAAFNVTVHAVAAPEFKLLGLQTSWDTDSICAKAVPEDRKTPIVATETLLPIVNLDIMAHRTSSAAPVFFSVYAEAPATPVWKPGR